MNWRFDRDRTTSFSRFMWQRFIDDKCFETAGALSYTTLVSLVPLTVAVLAMFSAFPVFAEWRNTLINFVFNFVPAAADTVKNALLAFADNASKLTGISVIVMLFSAISMMISIEDRLNRIWRVHQPRGWGPRLLLYWAALTLGPILVVGGLAASSYVTAVPLLKDAAGQLGFGARLLSVLPFVVTFITLWLLYTVVPNRKVSLKDGAIGALLGAVLFEIARWGFAVFVHHAQTYQQIYGAALAALPILLLWIYLSWIIVILGASVAASVSAYEYQVPSACLPEGSEFLGLLVVLRHFVEAQRKGVSVDVATVRVQEPYLRSASITVFFDDLQHADLIQRSESGGWLLSRSLDATDLLRVYRHAGYPLPLDPMQEAQTLGIQLPDELLQLLGHAADTLKSTLGAKLDQAYPPSPAPEEKEIVV
ncbi:membrane protein [Dyella sp. OK004]|uniref:YihY family inner membrane protein n=1 Tax=Dyella sp. OK004 TaxID=1855292 RepID=UPI0008E24118|nr:YihY family inner membrane protein [Dyella sp. OK004]SFR85436.1 membrane protein [Dyella sp. OK004]